MTFFFPIPFPPSPFGFRRFRDFKRPRAWTSSEAFSNFTCRPHQILGSPNGILPLAHKKQSRSRFSGRGCDEALFSEKKGVFSEKSGGNSVNEGFGKDFYRKGNSVKRFGQFTEPPDSENRKVAVLIPFPKISFYRAVMESFGKSEIPGQFLQDFSAA